VGGPYFYFTDRLGHPAGWYPVVALFVGPSAYMAAENSDWTTVTHLIKTPTTAGQARLFLTYAGYGTWQGGHPRTTGRASGKLWIRHLDIKMGGSVAALPPTIHVSDSLLQKGIETASECLHNASLSGQFIVSDGYTISGNIVPDLSFGLFGVRRLAHPAYMAMMKEHWQRTAQTVDQQGRVTSQRVMSQVLFPLGVDEIFSFTGDETFLKNYLPVADRALQYVIKRGDANGLSRLVEYGQWRMGEGADWVDWYPTRMEGKTLMFHLWYVRALRRLAALHEEFSSAGIGQLKSAHLYRTMADKVEQSLRRLYWRDDHFIPNIDFSGKPAEEKWLDDQVWAIRLGAADARQTNAIWQWMNRDPHNYEGVPMRWAGFDGPQHGPLSWFGRNGAGDILARYYSGDSRRGYELLTRISALFARDRNIYEAYDMQGNLGIGTNGWGNYTEHSGGYIWTVIEGPFGINFESDNKALATIKPSFPASWSHASAILYVRGSRLGIHYAAGSPHHLMLVTDGKSRMIRLILPDGQERIVEVKDRPLTDISF
jgi:hypothetical protein